MLSINTNLSSLIAQGSLNKSTNALNLAIERMTTGFKINSAKDNAANYSISTNMTTKINSYMVAEDNVAMGLDMLSTANGSLEQISDKLTRLRALATQAANGTYGQQSLAAINSEANALVDEISRLYSTAEYNGIKLFNQGNIDSGVDPANQRMARSVSLNTTYTDEEVAAMTTITQAKQAGSFTSGTTYSINSVEELCTFRDMVNSGKDGSGATFVLAKDLDLSTVSNWTAIGTSSSSSRFKGNFDGNGHTISNLKIDSTSSYQGLFGYVRADLGKTVSIKNLGLKDVNIKAGTSTGALVGYAYNYGTAVEISDIYVTGTITGTGESLGGIVGSVSNSSTGTFTLTNSYADCTISSNSNKAGGLIGSISTSNTGSFILNNCYSAGSMTSSGESVGGLIGYLYASGSNSLTIKNSYSTSNVSAKNKVGGIVGEFYSNGSNVTFDTNYFTGTATATSGTSVGGFIGTATYGTPNFTNNATVQADTFMLNQKTAEEIAGTYTPEVMGFTEANGWTIVDGTPVLSWQPEAQPPAPAPDPTPDPDPDPGSGDDPSDPTNPDTPLAPGTVVLQVGVSSGATSQIKVNLAFSLDGLEALRNIGLDNSTDFIDILDTMLETVSAKATEYGAVQNRLESALDEIAIQYENLVSSRSTLRDADIAEVSSQYIQQQILQQASATLLATANQSPSIALQLI